MLTLIILNQDSDPSSSTRHAFRSADGEYLSVYEKGPVYPGAGVRQQYFFISVSDS